MSFSPSIFVTGITGYVGGDAIFALLQKYPEWESSISVLIRDAQKALPILAACPKIRVVIGSLDDASILEAESEKADIVLDFADSDHPVSAEAIMRGANRHVGPMPFFVIHTSGTGILTWKTVQTESYGELEDKIYNDWDGVGEVTSLPDFAAHRGVDKIFLNGVNDEADVKAAIWEGNESWEGENRQTHVHVYDLSDLFVRLIEEAALGGGKATWGKEGYYFTSRAEQVWGEVAAAITSYAYQKSYISTDTLSEFSADELARSAGHSHAALIFGGNAREQSVRARKVLGWSPTRGSIFDEVPAVVESEAARLRIARQQ